MTSRISFFKLVKDEWKKLNWLMAVQLLGFLMLIPFRVLIVLASAVNMNERWNSELDLAQEFYYNFGLGLSENTFAVLATGIIVAICTFSYLFSSEKLDFLHSLPIKRTQLLAVKVTGSTLTFAAAWTTALLLGLLIGAMYGICSVTVIKEAAAVFVRGILQFLCSYATALIGIMLTGKLLTAVLACFSLGFYVPMVIYLGIVLQQEFFKTAFDYNRDASVWLSYSSPWAFCFRENIEESRLGLTGYMPSFGDLCQLLALAAVLFLIVVVLYRNRQTEAAGKALAFQKTEAVVKVLITVPIAVLSACLAHEIFENVLWEMGFLVLFGFLACMIMELIYRWDIRQVMKKKLHMILTIGIAAVIFLGTRFDFIKYDSYLPKKDDVLAMAVKDYSHTVFYPIDYESEYAHYAVTRELLDYLETENFDRIYDLAERAVQAGSVSTSASSEDHCYVYLKYHLKNGKNVYRCYWVDRAEYIAVVDELLKDETFQMKYYPILGWEKRPENYQGGYLSAPREYLTQFTKEGKAERKTWEMTEKELSEYWETIAGTEAENYHIDLTIPEEDMDKVVEVYQKELKESSYTEILEGKGWLNLYLLYKENGMHAYTTTDAYPIPYTFEETLSLLAEIWEEQEK